MRQLKQFLRAKKWICSNECKCITINMWRCADLQWGDEFCGCGGWGSSLPPLNNTIEATSESTGDLFDRDEGWISLTIEIDGETGDGRVVVEPEWIFEDERYVSESINLWNEIFESMPRESALTMIQDYTEFPSDVFEVLENFYENPTEANCEAAAEVLGNWIPVEW